MQKLHAQRVLRVSALVLSLALLWYGVARENREIASLSDGTSRVISGPEYVAGATVDSYTRRGAMLFDIFSLSPGTAKEKDCKT